jgi:predicted transcriptional regulator of viral defense system
MKRTDALGDLRRLGRPIVETREAAVRLDVSVSRASHLLRSLESSGLVRRLRRGLWAIQPDVDPFVIPPFLTAPHPAYVSFWSALAWHGMTEQIPRQIFVASLDRTNRISTSVATFSVHHMSPEVFGGYTGSERSGYLATPEKAIFDTVYLRSSQGGRVQFPELELPQGFDRRRIEPWVLRIDRPRLRTLVKRGLATALDAVALT